MANLKVENQPVKVQFLGGDAGRILFLTLLYMVQGLWFGFIGSALPVKLKKSFDLDELGIISLWFVPYSFKFIFAPLIDTVYSHQMGKRRTWIVPTQLIMGVIVFYFSFQLEELIEQKRVYLITVLFTVILWWCALQDIAVDGWWVTIVKEENTQYSALAQITGVSIGIFTSTTIFFAFSSVEFCKSYLYPEGQDLPPVVDEYSFMRYWSIFIFIIWAYTVLFNSEENDRIKWSDREIGIFEAVLRIFDLLKSKKILMLIALFVVVWALSNVNTLVGTIYLLEDLKYSQSKYSFVTLLVFPINIFLSIIIMKFWNSKILNTFMGVVILRAVNDLVIVNILFYFTLNEYLFDFMIFITLTISNFADVGMLAWVISYGNLICDLNVASTHLTFIFSMFNLANMIPKLYTHSSVMEYGIFTSNAVGCTSTIILTALMYWFYQNPKMYSRITSGKHEKQD